MLEVSIRIFSGEGKSALCPDYHEHLRMMRKDLGKEVETCMQETEDARIHQYYSLSPFYYLEIRFLRRMQAGVSVMCVSESAEEYAEDLHLPRFLRKWMFRYVRRFLNSLDYIVVSDEKLKEKLKEEGAEAPCFAVIPRQPERTEDHALWLKLYRRMENGAGI